MSGYVTKLAPVSAVGSAGLDAGTERRRDPAPTPETSADLRLVIEEGPGRQFVYKTLDRTTGEVVSQFPREEVLKLMIDPTYAAGRVIDTEA